MPEATSLIRAGGSFAGRYAWHAANFGGYQFDDPVRGPLGVRSKTDAMAGVGDGHGVDPQGLGYSSKGFTERVGTPDVDAVRAQPFRGDSQLVDAATPDATDSGGRRNGGVDEDGQPCARPGFEQCQWIHDVVSHLDTGQRQILECRCGNDAHCVVTPEAIAEAYYDDSPGHVCRTVRVRKWVEHEMHGS